MLLIAINIVFGIFNMLPMIPLDGGHVAIAVYERIRTQRASPTTRPTSPSSSRSPTSSSRFLVMFVLAGIFLDITHPLQIPH